MPHYPCVKCDDLVDPLSHISCPHCGAKKPFECSKCGKRMNQADIFHLEKLKTKKPLLCLDCGRANEVVKCGICKLSLVRSQGVQVSGAPDAKVYHKDCYDKQIKTVGMAHKFSPGVAVGGVVIALVAWLAGGFSAGGAAAVAGIGLIGGLMIRMIAEIFTPK